MGTAKIYNTAHAAKIETNLELYGGRKMALIQRNAYSFAASAQRTSDGLPTHVYVTVNFANGAAVKIDPEAMFSQARAGPLLTVPSEYYASVVRFEIPTQNIPLLLIPITSPVPVTPNEYLTPYNVILRYMPDEDAVPPVRQAVLWRPQFQNLKPGDIGFNYCYSVQYWVDLVNEALLTAHTTMLARIQAAFPGACPTPVNGLPAPFLQFDSNTSRMSLFAPTFGWPAPAPAALQRGMYYNPNDDAAPGPAVTISLNRQLSVMFPNFETIVRDVPDVVDPDVYEEFRVYQRPGIGNALAPGVTPTTNVVSVPTPIAYATSIVQAVPGATASLPATEQTWFYKMEQELPSLSAMSSLNSLAIQTSSIPIAQDQLTASTAFGQSTPALSTSDSSASFITDFIVAGPVGNEYRNGYVTYTPTAEYRLLDMARLDPLTTLDFRILWSDRFNNYYPVRIPPGCAVNLKLMFRRKDFLG